MARKYMAIRKDLEALMAKNDIKVVVKQDSWFMKILGILLFFNKEFMEEYTTTIGDVIYMPRTCFNNDYLFCRVIPHEIVHAGDFAEKGILLVALEYLFPQWLAAFSLLGLLFFVSSNYLFFFLFLIALLPWPSPSRKAFEMRGFAMSMAVDYWLCEDEERKKDGIDFYRDLIPQFTGLQYYYRMWPWEDKVKAEFEKWFKRLRDDDFCHWFWFGNALAGIFTKDDGSGEVQDAEG